MMQGQAGGGPQGGRKEKPSSRAWPAAQGAEGEAKRVKQHHNVNQM